MYKKIDFWANLSKPRVNKNITIRGSKNYFSEKKLISCLGNQRSFLDCSSCVEFAEDTIVNRTENICYRTNLNNISESNNFLQRECPSYTHEINNTCILNDILYNDNEKIKINIFPLKQYQTYICDELAGNLCYENHKFIGPISLNNNLNNLIGSVSYNESNR